MKWEIPGNCDGKPGHECYYGNLLIFNVWIFINTLCSEVMASFVYRDSLRHYCSDP